MKPKKYPFDYICYFDGACEPCNPGGALGYGYIIFDDSGKELKSESFYEPAKKENTNNIAEYNALIKALEFLKENHNKPVIYIRGDSMLVVKQMSGEWKMKNGAYIPYAKKCKELLSEFSNLNIGWISRDNNTIADNLSKKELKKHNITINH